MTSFRFRSIRAHLMTITLLAFAAVVIALAFIAVLVSREAMRNSIDADLRRRGVDFTLEIAQRGNTGPYARRGGRRSGDRPPEGDGPPHGGPPHGDPPQGGPGEGSQRPNPGWIAPAAIPVDPNERTPDPNSKPYDPEGFARASKGEELFRNVEVDGEPRRVFSIPVRRKGRITDVVQMAYEMRPALEQLDLLRWKLLLSVVPLGLLLGGVASLYVVDRLLRPLRRLNDEALRIGREGIGERLQPLGQDEFASLAHTLNGMIGDLESVYRSERDAKERLQESVERQRRFTGDASHEIKTPLSVIKAHLGILKRSKRNVADEADTVRAMERAADRMHGLVQGLLVLARTDSGIVGERVPCRLDHVLREAIESVPGSDTLVRLLSCSPATVQGSADELRRLFSNLIENSLKHSGAETPVEVALAEQGPNAVVTVTDRGVGIAPEHLPHLFERFYRVDRARALASGGTGLGLAICDQIARGHGGRIEVESEVGQGTRFTTTLPLRPAS